jgi:hypothetical protein
MLISIAGCEGEVGPCTSDTESRRLVYDAFGVPAFEGQALMIRSCGYGAHCHSENIDADHRYGAPIGLEYDLRLAGYDNVVDQEEVDRLGRMRARVQAHRRSIWAQVHSGRMPVGGAIGALVTDGAPTFFRALPDTPMPSLEEPEGREALRNWLACGSRIVERTAPVDDPSYVPLGEIVDPVDVEPLEPTWSSIYTRLIEPRCNGGPCHGSTREGELDLRGESEALAALVNAEANGDECGDDDSLLLVPGDSAASLLVHKLSGRDEDGNPVCGRLMPIGASRLSEQNLQAIRDWIDAGATM